MDGEKEMQTFQQHRLCIVCIFGYIFVCVFGYIYSLSGLTLGLSVCVWVCQWMLRDENAQVMELEARVDHMAMQVGGVEILQHFKYLHLNLYG